MSNPMPPELMEVINFLDGNGNGLTGWEILKLLGIGSSLENVSIGYVGFSIKKDHGEIYVSASNGLFRLTSTNLERVLTTGSAEELIATLDEMGYIFWRYGKRVDD